MPGKDKSISELAAEVLLEETIVAEMKSGKTVSEIAENHDITTKKVIEILEENDSWLKSKAEKEAARKVEEKPKRVKKPKAVKPTKAVKEEAVKEDGSEKEPEGEEEPKEESKVESTKSTKAVKIEGSTSTAQKIADLTGSQISVNPEEPIVIIKLPEMKFIKLKKKEKIRTEMEFTAAFHEARVWRTQYAAVDFLSRECKREGKTTAGYMIIDLRDS